MKLLLCFFVASIISFSTATASTADIFEELPAGGVYVFQAKNKYTIKCTADPIQPTILSKSCGYYGTSGFRPYYLKMKALLSNGKVVDYDISNADTMDECERKLAKQYHDLCSN